MILIPIQNTKNITPTGKKNETDYKNKLYNPIYLHIEKENI